MQSIDDYLRAERERVGPALHHLDAMIRISEAADGREFTRSQADDWAGAGNALVAELKRIEPTSAYIVRLYDDALPDAAELRGMRSWLTRRVDNLERQAHAAALPIPDGVNAAATIGDPNTMNTADSIRSMLTENRMTAEFVLPSTDEVRFIATDTAKMSTADFAGRVAVYERTLSPWLALAQVVTGTGRDLVYPKLTTDPTTYTPGQGTAITASDPVLGDITVTTTAYKAYGKLSAESVEDAEVNLADIVAQSAARSISLAFGNAATTAIITGITNGGTATGTGGNGTATSTFFGYEDLIDLEMGRPAPIRQRGVWVGSNTALKKVRKFKDQNGQYFWENGTPGVPSSFMGYPVYEDPYMAAVGSATKSIVFGDPEAALVIKQSPIRVELSRDFAFNEDVVSWKVVHRIGIGIKDATALAYLVSANT